MLHGIPSRNGITRTDRPSPRQPSSAPSMPLGSCTRRTPFPPPVHPSVASMARTTPSPRSSSSHTAPTAPTVAATTRLGALGTPHRSHRESITVLSSSASHSGRRWARNGRPSSSDDSLRKSPMTTAERSGSNRSSSARAGAGRSAIAALLAWTARATSPAAGRSSKYQLASSGSGSGPVPVPLVASTNTSVAPSSRTDRTVRHAPATTSCLRITRRPSNSGRSASDQYDVSTAVTVRPAGRAVRRISRAA